MKKDVTVHPLVIVSACDHHTRVTVGGSHLPKDAPSIGLLFGSMTSGEDEDGTENTIMHIIDATDAVYAYDSASGAVKLEMKQIQSKRDLWVRVYPKQPLLGWYAVGSEVTPLHMSIHKEISSLTADPDHALLLLMNPSIDSEAKQLPILLFELSSVGSTQVFLEIPFKLESSNVERIGMDKIITSNRPEDISPVEVQNNSTLVSLKALLSRVDIIVDEVTRMQSGEIPVNYEVLCKAAKICNLLPACNIPQLPVNNDDTCNNIREVTDSLTLSTLGMVANNLRQLQALNNSYRFVWAGERGKSSLGTSLRSELTQVDVEDALMNGRNCASWKRGFHTYVVTCCCLLCRAQSQFAAAAFALLSLVMNTMKVTGLGLLGAAAAAPATKMMFTQMPESIPGNFTTYQYDLGSEKLTKVGSWLEESYTAYDFVSGAAVCGNTYYASIDDSIIDWGLAAISLDTGNVQIFSVAKGQMPSSNLLHNLWCDPSGEEGSLLVVESVTSGDPVFGLYSMKVSDNHVTQQLIGEFPYDKVENYFAASETEFQTTPDRSQVWANFGNSKGMSGNLHIMNSKTGAYTSYSYPVNSGYPYTTVPLENNDPNFLLGLNYHGVLKAEGFLDGDSVTVKNKEETEYLYTGSQPWTVEASTNQVYAITNEKEGQQWLDILDAESGDLLKSVSFKTILRSKGYIGGLALV